METGGQEDNAFQLLLKQFDSLKISLASLNAFKNVDFFADYLFRKCRDNKMA